MQSTATDWDLYFVDMARWVAERRSKDPSTKCGAVVARGRELVSAGYNGFARGVRDLPARYEDREVKYRLVVHAEVNAILTARRDLTGCTLYTWPFMPCSSCAAMVIQAGVARVVAPRLPEDKEARWGESIAWSMMQFSEAGVEVVLV